MNNNLSIILLIFLIVTICSCSFLSSKETNENITVIDETEVIQIPLSGQISDRKSEISGLSWYKNKLIILPQFPNRFGNEDGKIFYIEKTTLTNFINGSNVLPISPQYYTINTNQFEDLFQIGSGFEAVTFIEDTVYFTIENLNKGNTKSIIISGTVDTVQNNIELDKNSMVIDPYSLLIHNISDESILNYNGNILPMYEVFGENVNNSPMISVFDQKLNFISQIKFPHIEYRITDVTNANDSGYFWAINYFYPGDRNKLKPAVDSLLIKYGIGKTHKLFDPIERLVQFKIESNEIIIVDKAPIYLKLEEGQSRNWEGLAKFDKNGFILATDTFPNTILAYIQTK